MTEPNSFQIFIIGFVLVGGICSILLGCSWYYIRDCKLHPEKHKDDFKLRNDREVKE